MTEQGQEPTPDTQAATGQPEQPNTVAQTSSTEWTLDAALAKIKELNNENAKHRTAAKAAEKAAAEAEAARLAEQGKYKELWEQSRAQLDEYEPMKARLQELTERTQQANEARIKAIPESMRGLVPDYDDPFKLSAWLDANSAVFQKPQAPSLDAGAGGNRGGATVSDDVINELAARWRVKPEYIDREAAAKMLKR